jgi:phenylalanyl-tRNA synthetase beta chain
VSEIGWRSKNIKADLYFLKGIITSLLKLLGLEADDFENFTNKKLRSAFEMRINGSVVLQFGEVDQSVLNRFDIRQPVFFAGHRLEQQPWQKQSMQRSK